MFKIQDIGELGYGAVVTLGEWWDNGRIDAGKLKKGEVAKKLGFWAYLVLGLPATLISAMRWMPRQSLWFEHVSHGFIYDLPRFAMNLVQSLKKEEGGGAGSSAVRQAQEILRQRQLAAGTKRVERTYEPEMNKAVVF